MADGAGSQRPAVYLAKGKGSHDLTVEINVTRSVNCPPTLDLVGEIDKLEIRGKCPTSVGKQSFTASILLPPDGVAWYRGEASWTANVPGCTSFSLGSTRVEIFFVLDTPIPVYQSGDGVWVEALRLLCDKAAVVGLEDKRKAAAAVAVYCHGGHGLRSEEHT